MKSINFITASNEVNILNIYKYFQASIFVKFSKLSNYLLALISKFKE